MGYELKINDVVKIDGFAENKRGRVVQIWTSKDTTLYLIRRTDVASKNGEWHRLEKLTRVQQ